MTDQSLTVAQSGSSLVWTANKGSGTWYFKVTNTLGTTPNQVSTTSFSLTVPSQCKGSNQNPTVTVTNPTPDQYYLKGTPGSLSYTLFAVAGSTMCFDSDAEYSIKITPTTSIFTLDAQRRTISWSAPPDCSTVYNITLTGKVSPSMNTNNDQHQAHDSMLIQCFTCAATPEIITISTPSAPATQSYTLAATPGTLTFGAFSENSFFCVVGNFTYSMIVTAPAGVTNTTWIALNNQTITWSTQNYAHAGAYTITIVGSLPTTPKQSGSFAFVLNVLITCATSNEKPAIVVPTPTANQTFKVGISGSVTAATYAISPATAICKASDIVYSLTSTPANSFIMFSPSTRVITWNQPTACQQYTVVLTGTITTSSTPTTYFATSTIILNCYTCQTTPETLSITATPPGNQSYALGSPQGSVVFSAFTSNSVYCKDTDFVYSMTVTSPDGVTNPAWITLKNQTIAWSTAAIENAKTYSVTITGVLPTSPQQFKSISFLLNVTAVCSQSLDNPSIATGLTPNQTFTVGASGSVTATPFTISPSTTFCQTSDIVYSLVSTPANSFITFNPTTRVISWTEPTMCQTYTAILTGSLQTSQTLFQKSVTISIQCFTCATSVESISITATAPATQTYTLGQTQGSVTLAAFTENSTYCQSSDFTYQMTVTGPTGVTDTSWISLSGLTITWQTSTFANVGIYTVTVTGTLPMLLQQSQSTSFILTVNATCATSLDKPTLSISQQSTDQTYYVGISGSTQIAAFIVDSTSQYCSTNNIVYSMTTTPSNSFITFNPNTRVVAWTAPPTCDSYTVTVTATITTAATPAMYSTTETIKLVCYTCATSPEIITISQTQQIAQQAVVGIAGSVTLTSFTSDSSYCKSSDFKYSIVVTDPSGAATVAWVTITGQTVSWQPPTNAMTGAYTITITGTLPTSSGQSSSTTMTLNVAKQTCAKSYDQPNIVVTQPTSNFVYVQGSTDTITVAPFTISPLTESCAESNIVYSLTSSPANNFVTFDPSTRVISLNSPAVCASYILKLTGSMTTAASPSVFSASHSFTLNCYTCATSPETITLTGTAPADQQYFLSSTAGSVTFSPFSEDSSYCAQSDIVYSISVVPPLGVLDTSWLRLQGNKIQWQTSDFANLGTYQITINGQLSHSLAQVSFTIYIGATCATFNEKPQIVVPSLAADQTYELQTSGSITVPKFEIENQGKYCDQSDIVYSLAVTPYSSEIQFNPSTRVITWNELSTCSSYELQVTGTVTTALRSYSQTDTIMLQCFTCQSSQEIIEITGIAPPSQFYSYGAPANSTVITPFTQNSHYCQDQDLYYTMSIKTPNAVIKDTSWITFNNFKVAWETTTATFDGAYTITITAVLPTTPQQSGSISFVLNVGVTCQSYFDQPTVVATHTADQPISVGASGSVTAAAFTLSGQSGYCQSSDIVYTITGPDFVSFNPSTRVITWTSPPACQDYQIKLTGTVMTSASPYTYMATDTILLKCYTCNTTPEKITVSGVAPQAQLYTLGTPAKSVQFQPFAENSSYCQSSDITYSISVKSPFGVQNTQWIQLTNMNINFAAPSYQYVGDYIITITGTLPTGQFGQVQFKLSVVATCETSGEEPKPVVEVPMPDQQLLLGVTGSVTVSAFTVATPGKYCNKKNIVYSVQITPEQTFISFDPGNLVVSWKPTTVCKNYTVKVIGRISTSSAQVNYNVSQEFKLICQAGCYSDTVNKITLQGVAPGPQSFKIGQSGSQTKIQPFSQNGPFCLPSDIQYSMTVSNRKGQDTSWITFNQDALIVTWSDQSALAKPGVFTVTITGRIPVKNTVYQNSITFNLTVSQQQAVQVVPENEQVVVYNSKDFTANDTLVLIATKFAAKNRRDLQNYETLEGRIWLIFADTTIYYPTAEIYIWLTQQSGTTMKVYSGTDSKNKSLAIEGNQTMVVGAPIRIKVSEQAIVVIQQTSTTEEGSASFSFQIIGRKYRWFQRPFICLYMEMTAWYLFLVSMPLALCLVLCMPTIAVLTPLLWINGISLSAYCCKKCQREGSGKVRQKVINLKIDRCNSLSPRLKNERKVDEDWIIQGGLSANHSWQMVLQDSSRNSIVSKADIEEEWDSAHKLNQDSNYSESPVRTKRTGVRKGSDTTLLSIPKSPTRYVPQSELHKNDDVTSQGSVMSVKGLMAPIPLIQMRSSNTLTVPKLLDKIVQEECQSAGLIKGRINMLGNVEEANESSDIESEMSLNEFKRRISEQLSKQSRQSVQSRRDPIQVPVPEIQFNEENSALDLQKMSRQARGSLFYKEDQLSSRRQVPALEKSPPRQSEEGKAPSRRKPPVPKLMVQSEQNLISKLNLAGIVSEAKKPF